MPFKFSQSEMQVRSRVEHTSVQKLFAIFTNTGLAIPGTNALEQFFIFLVSVIEPSRIQCFLIYQLNITIVRSSVSLCTTLHFLCSLQIGLVSCTVILHQAGKAFQEQTFWLTEPILKLQRNLSVVKMTLDLNQTSKFQLVFLMLLLCCF